MKFHSVQCTEIDIDVEVTGQPITSFITHAARQCQGLRIAFAPAAVDNLRVTLWMRVPRVPKVCLFPFLVLRLSISTTTTSLSLMLQQVTCRQDSRACQAC